MPRYIALKIELEEGVENDAHLLDSLSDYILDYELFTSPSQFVHAVKAVEEVELVEVALVRS